LLGLLLWACQSGQPSGDGPITAPPNEWTWIDFADATCANGASTGLAVNPKDGAGDVVIYLMGGGACWDWQTCYGLQLAWNVELGYTSDTFATEQTRNATIFDRTSSANPFKDASYVYVPYCTGDVHVGTTKASYGAVHVGAKNLDVFLKRLVPTFANAKRVFIVGTSAGGFGAQLNAERFADAFAPLPVSVMADSAALVTPADGKWDLWLTTWQAQTQSCEGCDAQGWVDLARRKSVRLGVVSSQQDWLVSTFMGLSGAQFQGELSSLVDAELRTPTSAAFVTSGNQHVFFQSMDTVSGLSDWVTAWRDGTDSFTTRTP
jgi:hypothetical protein